jgi:hypothetical protein
MDNTSATAHRKELPHHLLEAIRKLALVGASHQAISSVLQLKFEVIQQVLAKDHSQTAKSTESITEESKQYGCVLSNEL